MANNFQYAQLFQAAADKQVEEISTTGWMEANAGKVIYNGGNTVKIPTMTMDALANYSRDTGYDTGAVTLTYQTFTMRQDRGKKFRIDSMDVDETNFVANASDVISEFQRTKVIPEIDAYRYSQLFAACKTANKTSEDLTASDVLSALLRDLNAINDVAGETDVVITVPYTIGALLDASPDFNKMVSIDTFTQGGISMTVKTINGMPIIRVPSARMKSAYTFNNNGFAPTSSAKDINWIITRRSDPIAISKTEKVQIITPEVNQAADAYDINFRKYHDLWVTDSAKEILRVSVSAT